MNSHPVETIDGELKGLMDTFQQNCRLDLESMRKALADHDHQKVTRLGHSLKGTGLSYGLKGMAELGREIEAVAEKGEETGIARALDRFSEYLEQVVIRFRS